MSSIDRLSSEAPLALVFCLSLLMGYAVTSVIRRRIIEMITSSGYTRPNYKGIDIPAAAGLMITLAGVSVVAFLTAVKLVHLRTAAAFFLLIQGFGILGLIDDLMGSRERSGLKGHLLALLIERKLTTGALKAISGGALSLLASLIIGGAWYSVIIRALVLALSANTVNLLDLRPGRAIKGYLILTFVCFGSSIAFGSINNPSLAIYTPLAVLVGCAVAYAPLDLKAKSMMGDSGSNPLGAAAGLAIVSAGLGIWWNVGWLVLLCGIHLFAEKYSITKTIESNKFLKALDMLGRDA